MKSFLLPVGRMAGASLSTLFAAMSCGATLPVSGLDILYLTDCETDPLLSPMVRDLNHVHDLLLDPDNTSLFPSSFVFDSLRPRLPEMRDLSADPASSALIGALRGQGIPLSYKTDREAVEWAFALLLSDAHNDSLSLFRSWISRIRNALDAGEKVRVAVLCDLCDPFSAGAAFSLLRHLHGDTGLDPSCLGLFCLSVIDMTSPDLSAGVLHGSLRALAAQALICRTDFAEKACAGAAWLLGLPSSFINSQESYRVLYAALARRLAFFFCPESNTAPGLHTVKMPGIVNFYSLGNQAGGFASFLHTSVWLLCDLLPSLSACLDHPGGLRSLTPNSRNGLFRRLFQEHASIPAYQNTLQIVMRAFSAVLSEILSLIHFLPEQLRLSDASDSRWRQIVQACGRTVTVASEYDVSMAEAREGGILDIKPVHRVSMADTEEEKLERRLEEIAAQLKEEEKTRSALFSEVGTCWAVLAVRDCRSRCLEALDRSKEQQSHFPDVPDSDRLSAAALYRRIRLLEAAVSRCDSDLADLKNHGFADSTSVSASWNSGKKASFSGELFDSTVASKLLSLLTLSGDEAEDVRKDLQTSMPALFFGFQLSDTRSLLRRLFSECETDPSGNPIRLLLLSVNRVSRTEIQPLHFVSSGEIPPISLLPDLYPDTPILTADALLPLLPQSVENMADSDSAKRGLLTMLLLRQYRRRTSDEASLSFKQFKSADSPVLRMWLSSQGSESVWIVCLGSEQHDLPFALVLPGRKLIPARMTAAHAEMIPGFSVPWFDKDHLSFTDPCKLIGESDLSILLEMLSHMIQSGKATCDPGLIRFLDLYSRDLTRSQENIGIPDRFSLRLKAAFGLRLLPAFNQTLVRITCSYERFLASDDIASRLVNQPSVAPSSCDVEDDVIYLYRNVPFARENSHSFLESIPLPAENWILNLLEQECRILARSSDDYHDSLVRELTSLLTRYPEAIQEARRAVTEILEEAQNPVPDADTELLWPWDPASPSVRTILTECLGERIAEAALTPFSDFLTLFPARGNEVIGDALMSSMCIVPAASVTEQENAPSVLPDAVLPPLSPEICEALCSFDEGKTLLRPGLLSFERGDNQSIRAVITFEGTFTVRLHRDYMEDEILHFYSHDIPTLAVWPDVPLPPEEWHAYFIYAGHSSGLRISARNAEGETVSSDGKENRQVCRSNAFPLSFTFFRENHCIGSLPNLLPVPDIEKTDAFTACVDFGSVGTSAVFSVGHNRHPLQGPTMVRTLLNNPSMSRDLLRNEFLPSVPVSALLPTVTRIFRNAAGMKPLPFEDGIILMPSDLQNVLNIPAGSLYTSLKWEEDKGRSVMLCLHQIMLMIALQARCEGAPSLYWRFAVPDDMGKTGRERLISLFSSVAIQVGEESGFPPPEKSPLITFAPESSALGAYFRLCASEDTRGGFMTLDIGACTADFSLFLRGREQAVQTCQIPLGIHYMLLPSLLRDTCLMRQELSFIQDPVFRQEMSSLERCFHEARSDYSALRLSRIVLDTFIADSYVSVLPGLLQNPLTGMPTRIGSVLLLHLSFLMMMSGLMLMQIAADPGKNDFLPEQMSLCLSGRGSHLIEHLPDPYKTSLWRFLTMFRNQRVSSLSLLFSSEKKMEIPVGLSALQEVSTDLPPASAIPAAISVRPEELLPRFILQFAKEYPASAEILFNGFFTGDFYHPFTPYGESVLSEAINRSFTEQAAHRPYDALASWIGILLDLISGPQV